MKFYSTIFILLASLLGLITTPSQASDNLSIRSDSQSLSTAPKSNDLISVFRGNVFVNYKGEFATLKASQVTVYANGNSKRIVAVGNPVVVESKSQQFNLKAKEVVFEVNANLITAKNADVTYRGNTLNSNLINYNLQTQNLKAFGSSSNQVKTVINQIPGKK